ncbi:hypothetical protein NL108_014185 [Boleophthalmus pectinirostris]|nr:hypothetical protein NL108_014185 [Boleophthalmus pectinirostris]
MESGASSHPWRSLDQFVLCPCCVPEGQVLSRRSFQHGVRKQCGGRGGHSNMVSLYSVCGKRGHSNMASGYSVWEKRSFQHGVRIQCVGKEVIPTWRPDTVCVGKEEVIPSSCPGEVCEVRGGHSNMASS